MYIKKFYIYKVTEMNNQCNGIDTLGHKLLHVGFTNISKIEMNNKRNGMDTLRHSLPHVRFTKISKW
jgi:hypothetical protein